MMDGESIAEESGSDEGSQQQVDDGVLTVSVAGCGLSNLNWSADGTRQVFLHLTLHGLQLTDISVLESFIHLQKVEIPFNEITDLSALGFMTSLLELDASHNDITQLLEFSAPRNLKTVKMSHNRITDIPDLSVHHYLHYLDLDHNSIRQIKGLSGCHRLTYLSLKHNHICRVEGLDNLPIKHLGLSGNDIQQIENLETVCLLQTVELAENKIRSLAGLAGHKYLDSIDLQYNQLIDLVEIRNLSSLDQLRTLRLAFNPVCELPDYKLAVIFSVQQITTLDTVCVTAHDKVSARNLFNPSIEYLAARDHMMHAVYSFLQPTRLLDITLPMQDSPYPMLVLVGPQGIGKKSLAQKLAEDLPDYFGYAASHTTRLPYRDEAPGNDYHFVSLDDFETGIKMGSFLQTCSYHGELYGLSLEAVEIVARESLACVVQMELEGVLTLKNSYLEPRYVLLLPATREAHERRLASKGVHSVEQIAATLDRSEFYTEYNQQHPGIFDTTYMSDDITETYCWLRKLVLQYLGVPATPDNAASELELTATDLSMDRVATGLMFYGPTEDREKLIRGRSAPAASGHMWSRPSLMDSARSHTAAVIHMSIQPPHGPVEAESVRRRQSAVKEVVVGRSQPLYEQLVHRGVASASEAMNRDDCGAVDTSERRWYSAPANTCHRGPADDDRSESGSCVSLAEDMVQSPDHRSETHQPVKRQLPDDTLLDLTTPSTNVSCLSSREGVSRRSSEPISAVSGGSAVHSRPGSSRLPVLPPIRQIWSADAVIVK